MAVSVRVIPQVLLDHLGGWSAVTLTVLVCVFAVAGLDRPEYESYQHEVQQGLGSKPMPAARAYSAVAGL